MSLYYIPSGHAIHGTLAVATHVNGNAARRLAPAPVFYELLTNPFMKSEKESQDSNDKMESPETDSSGTGKKSVRQRRDSTISFRVSRSQRERIASLADECGMSLSDYVLSRAHGYDPKPRLTPIQEDVRRELIIARSDYARYTAMLNSMPQEERKAMFRDTRWMGETLKLLGATAERITRILKRYFSTNGIPAAGTMEKDNETDES